MLLLHFKLNHFFFFFLMERTGKELQHPVKKKTNTGPRFVLFFGALMNVWEGWMKAGQSRQAGNRRPKPAVQSAAEGPAASRGLTDANSTTVASPLDHRRRSRDNQDRRPGSTGETLHL